MADNANAGLACSASNADAGDAAGVSFWDAIWQGYEPEPYPGPLYDFHSLYLAHLPRGGPKRLLEIGAVPGNLMAYFHFEFGYNVSGIDYSPHIELVHRSMLLNGISRYEAIHGDVFAFNPPCLYDIVFSSGFVEHFDDYEAALAVHARLLAPGGLLILTVPNTRFLHAFLMKRYCPSVLAVHRTTLMQRSRLSNYVSQLGFEVLFCNYLRTFRPFYPLPPVAAFCARAAGRLIRAAGVSNIPNSFASPYLHLIARKALPHRAETPEV